jgi:hypothetical protein
MHFTNFFSILAGSPNVKGKNIGSSVVLETKLKLKPLSQAAS